MLRNRVSAYAAQAAGTELVVCSCSHAWQANHTLVTTIQERAWASAMGNMVGSDVPIIVAPNDGHKSEQQWAKTMSNDGQKYAQWWAKNAECLVQVAKHLDVCPILHEKFGIMGLHLTPSQLFHSIIFGLVPLAMLCNFICCRFHLCRHCDS